MKLYWQQMNHKMMKSAIHVVVEKHGAKGNMPNSNIAIIWTPIVEWFAVRCAQKNGHENDTCLIETGLQTLYNANLFQGQQPTWFKETFMTTK